MSDYEDIIRKMAMDRFPSEYLALHGRKAYDGFVLLRVPLEEYPHDAQYAHRFLFPNGAQNGAAYPPQLIGAGNYLLGQDAAKS